MQEVHYGGFSEIHSALYKFNLKKIQFKSHSERHSELVLLK